MKVLLCVREDYLRNLAGDSVIAIKTAEYLRKKGVSASINRGSVADYSEYDIIHLFNLTRLTETFGCFALARRHKKPVVITPVYWDLSRYYAHTRDPAGLRMWREYREFRSEILCGSAMILPSSRAEAELIKKEYGRLLPTSVVYCGVDAPELETKRGAAAKAPYDGEYILCAARVCPRKNQLALAKAARSLGLRLVLAGGADNQDYLDRCMRFKNVTYAGFLSLRKLAPLYRGARLHALAGFVETPGLSNLEAAVCGCAVLSTAEGSAEEYFGDMAAYCDPYDPAALTGAVEAGLALRTQPRLKAHILENFTAERCLEPLLNAYSSIAT